MFLNIFLGENGSPLVLVSFNHLIMQEYDSKCLQMYLIRQVLQIKSLHCKRMEMIIVSWQNGIMQRLIWRSSLTLKLFTIC
jgi:hypothetical protein